MNPIDRLNRVRNSYHEARRLLLKVEELENLATKMTPVYSNTPKGDSQTLKDDSWAKLIDYKMLCEERVREYLDSCRELEDELRCIRSDNIRTAMKYYYVDHKKQETIAEIMGYSEREIRYYLQRGRKIYTEAYK